MEQTEPAELPGSTDHLLVQGTAEYLRQEDITRINFFTASQEATPNLSINADSNLTKNITPFRVHGFADKENLAGWFPRIHANEKTSWRIRLSKRNQALLLQVALIGSIFAANLFILLYSSRHYPSVNGVGLLYAGDCDTVKSANRWLHLLINILSTGMLSASTYCVQLQASPTRADIDKAHKLNKWLDIGAPSIRNLRAIGRWRLASCIILILSSIPIHLVFNSAVFQALASNDYSVAVVKDSFLSGASWNLATAERNSQDNICWNDTNVIPPEQSYQSIIEGIQNDVMNGLYKTKNVSECYALYGDYWEPRQGNVVITVKNESVATDDTDSLLLYSFVVPGHENFAKALWAINNGTGIRAAVAQSPSPLTTWYLGPPHYVASYCLVQVESSKTDRCRLQYSMHILSVVVFLNLLKLVVLFFVWMSRRRAEKRRKTKSEEWGAREDDEESILARREAVLSTLGDAIASFMQEPDETTKDMCLATKYDFLPKSSFPNHQRKEGPSEDAHPRKWKMSQYRWMSAATWSQWSCLILLYIGFITGICTSWGLLLSSVSLHRGFTITFSFLRSLGFGSVSPLTFLNVQLPRGDPVGLIQNVLVVNSPQLLFSIMYTVCGAIMTTCLVQHEFSLMYTKAHRKPLRVSEPIGIQRSSYFISLPLRYGIPLNLSAAFFHWLISQGYFLARVTALLPNGQEDYGNSFSTLGYSPYALIVTGIVAFINLIIILLMGFRKYDGTMSMVSTNSLAISATCHSLSDDREYGHELPVQWGVVEVGEDGVGHCAFTTAPYNVIRKAEEDILYR
ncbi:hypothetical protein F4777DRAFT_536397 [Nemania sp. FL0916]|nr:hypothetical protein F4777DRAFT_536397 [Nemania sp. FL0916]